MASKKRVKRETIRGLGNDPLILDPMRWGEIDPLPTLTSGRGRSQPSVS